LFVDAVVSLEESRLHVDALRSRCDVGFQLVENTWKAGWKYLYKLRCTKDKG